MSKSIVDEIFDEPLKEPLKSAKYMLGNIQAANFTRRNVNMVHGKKFSGPVKVGELIEALKQAPASSSVNVPGTLCVYTDRLGRLMIEAEDVIGLITEEAPLGIEFINGGNEHPLFENHQIYYDENGEYVMVLVNEEELKRIQESGAEFWVYPVDGNDVDAYDTVYLIYAAAGMGQDVFRLIGYMADEDDLMEGFNDTAEDAMTAFTVINEAVDCVENGTSLPTHMIHDYQTLWLTMAVYAYNYNGDSHFYVNAEGGMPDNDFNVVCESVTTGKDEDGDPIHTALGVCYGTLGNIYGVYTDLDKLEDVIANSKLIAQSGTGYVLGVPMGEIDQISKMDNVLTIEEYAITEGLGIDIKYDPDSFVGAMCAMVEMTNDRQDYFDEGFDLLEGGDDDEDDDNGQCLHPELTCMECPLLGTNDCPDGAEDD